ncbi:MAG: ASKHA domain-containing protein [Armatimonadota bacterium]
MTEGNVTRVVFSPGRRQVEVEPGTSLMEAAEKAGLALWAPCGRRGACGQCKVVVQPGSEVSELTEAETRALGPEEREHGYRLACQTRAMGETCVTLPRRFATTVARVLEEGMTRDVALRPNVVQHRLEMPGPSLSDQTPDLARIERALGFDRGRLAVSREVAAGVPTTLRDHDFRVTVTLVGNRLASVSGPRDRSSMCGAAFDIGTTTIVCYLVDLANGKLLAAASGLNAQATYGADVISRLDYARQNPRGLPALRSSVLGTMNTLLGEACAEVQVALEDVYEATVVGNTCMVHLFLGLDPSNIATTPFVPVLTRPYTLGAREVGLDIHPEGAVLCLPGIAGYVGADIVGVMTATELDRRSGIVAAVDIGTNGEVVLWTGEELLCCSCAAGPAFEGAQIRHGMRAMTGAIDSVGVDDGDLRVTTIDEAPAVGLCGSGLLDAAATLLDIGLIDEAGRLGAGDGMANAPDAIRRRIRGEGTQAEFVLAWPEATSEGFAITLAQADVRQLQLASGAVRAGIEVLLGRAGLRAQDLDELLLAGAFGSYLRKESALRTGMLPPIPAERIVSVGNAAGMGAVLSLISTDVREYAEDLAVRAKYVELSAAPEFQTAFVEAMVFPSQNLS